MSDQPKLIPNVIGRIDPITDAIRAADWEAAKRLTALESQRLRDIEEQKDREWRQAQGKSVTAFRFGEFLAKASPEELENLRAECG